MLQVASLDWRLSTASPLSSVFPWISSLVSRVSLPRYSRSSSVSPVFARPNILRLLVLLSPEKSLMGLSLRYSSSTPFIMLTGEVLLMLLPEASIYLSSSMPIRGRRSVNSLSDTSTHSSLGRFISGLRSLISLPLRSSLVSSLQLPMAEMSLSPMPLRSSSVTSDLKVTPPKLISCSSSSRVSLCMAQLGRDFDRASSWAGLISMPFMLRLARLGRTQRGLKSSMGLLSRYRVRRPTRELRGVRSLILLPLRLRLTRPPMSARAAMLLMELPARDRVSRA